ncbi:disease resistance-like protein isoform X1 [Cinnamomum micranthum f. kanehirae]|uniref:Disease resistance-like protein isoform X1 n=1 Tax=Cinnamomum micranthum f. kanehirae TaxID=337451 RepID=A0A3S4Q2M7_9MAGN|nr:disease resistance-like protein isoform X1 [Cinnamomum micranthum f. kanehirae]
MNETSGKIGIQGMGGVGKTSLSETHSQSAQRMPSSLTIFQYKKLQSDIANAISLSLNNDHEVEQRSRQLCEGLLRRSKFVLILDDIWEAFSLEDVEFLSQMKIMVVRYC